MGRDRSGMGRSRRPVVLVGLLLLLFATPPAPLVADDVVPAVRAAFEAGQVLLRKGDRGSLEKALRLLDTRKDEALASVDYWELYARVWLGLKKGPAGLWDGIVAPRREAAPRSPVFDLVQARLAEDPEEKRGHLERALTRSVKDLRAKVAMADFLLDEGEEDDADALLEEILDADPDNLGALLAKARLSISDGLPGEAVEFLEQALAKHKTARLHHLLARAYERQAQDGEDVLAKALASAAQAVGLEPEPAYVETFVALLEKTGDAATAAKALREHFERTRLPLLGALLAKSAFRAGDYEAAVLGLSAGDGRDLGAVKGLAVSYARLGKAEAARRASRRVVTLDSRGVLFAAEIELWLGNGDAVQKRLGSLADPDARRLKVQAHAWLGDVDALAAIAGKEARDGSRAGEDVLLAWLQAQVLDRLGTSHADAVREKLLEARFAAGRRVIEQAGNADRDIGEVKTAGWVRRAATYVRGRCGRFVVPASDSDGFGTTFFLASGDDKPSVAMALSVRTDCGNGGTFHLQFNRKASKTPEGFIELFREQEKLGDFAPAEAAFRDACAACVDGKAEEAVAAFTKALAIEPGWYRARVFRSIVRALAPGGEKRDEARDGAKALEPWPDDFALRRLVVFLRAWAGDADLLKEIGALAEREAQFNVRDLAGL